MTEPVTTHASLERLEARRENANKSYLEFLRVPTMSAGLYTLEAGATDPQRRSYSSNPCCTSITKSAASFIRPASSPPPVRTRR